MTLPLPLCILLASVIKTPGRFDADTCSTLPISLDIGVTWVIYLRNGTVHANAATRILELSEEFESLRDTAPAVDWASEIPAAGKRQIEAAIRSVSRIDGALAVA